MERKPKKKKKYIAQWGLCLCFCCFFFVFNFSSSAKNPRGHKSIGQRRKLSRVAAHGAIDSNPRSPARVIRLCFFVLLSYIFFSFARVVAFSFLAFLFLFYVILFARASLKLLETRGVWLVGGRCKSRQEACLTDIDSRSI